MKKQSPVQQQQQAQSPESQAKAKAAAVSSLEQPQGNAEEAKKLASGGGQGETQTLDAASQQPQSSFTPDPNKSQDENAKLAALDARNSGPSTDEGSEEETASTEGQEIGEGQANAQPGGGGGEEGDGEEANAEDASIQVSLNGGGAALEGEGAPGAESAEQESGGGGGGGGGGAGGGGGGGGGGGAGGGGGGEGAQAAEQAPVSLGNGSAEETFTLFQEEAPTFQALSWNDLGNVMNEGVAEDESSFQETVPEFNAVMDGQDPLAPQTDIATPTGNLEEDSPGATPEAEIEETVQGPEMDTSVDRGWFSGWFGGEGDKSSNASAVASSIDSVQTRDPNLETSPGAPPPVPLQGESNPARVSDKATATSAEAVSGLDQARNAVIASPGAEQVQPLLMNETFSINSQLAQPTNAAATLPVTDMEEYVAIGLPANVMAAFDELNQPVMSASLKQGTDDITAGTATRDADREAEVNKATEEQNKAIAAAHTDQTNQVAQQRSLIDAERASTMQQQQAAVADTQAQIDAERTKQLDGIDKRVKADEAKINSEYAKADRAAKAKVAEGERQAEAEKRKAEEESNNRSWWEKACDFVADCISALADVIGDIFDAIRSAVTAILDAVKDLANTIIDAAVSFINDAIAAFGDLCKGLIQGLLGDLFPELAAALCEYVDSAVTAAQEYVTAVGETLKEGIAALCDALEAALNTILSIYEAVVNTALAFANAVITGDWKAFLMAALEAALKVAGISEDEFYGFVGRAEDTIDIIVNDPGGFLSNAIDALSTGFGQFSDNFLDHLQVGFVDWMTGQAGDAGITMPDELNLAGIFDISMQVLGLTYDNLREKAVEHIGEDAVEQIEFVWGFVESAIEGGLDGLWEHVQEYMGGLWDMVIGAIQDWLMEKIVVAAVTKLASMFSPVGAIIQAVLTAWNMYCFIRDQIARIWGVVTSIVNGIGDIARGQIGGAANMVEDSLASLVPVAIDLLARLLGIGGIGAKVKEVIGGVQEMVDSALDSMIEKVKGLFTGGGGGSSDSESDSSAESAQETGTGNASQGDGEVGARVGFQAEGGDSHTLWVDVQGGQANLMVASTPMALADRITAWESQLADLDDVKRAEATPLISNAKAKLAASDILADQLAATSPSIQSGSQGTNANDASGLATYSAKDDELEAQERTLGDTLAALFGIFGGADGALIEKITAKLAGPDAAKLPSFLVIGGITEAEVDAMDGLTLQKRGREYWFGQMSNNEKAFLADVAGTIGDAVASRKLTEVDRETMAGATAYRDIWYTKTAIGYCNTDNQGSSALYGVMQSSVEGSWKAKGEAGEFTGVSELHRGMGVDGFYHANVTAAAKSDALDAAIAQIISGLPADQAAVKESEARAAFTGKRWGGSDVDEVAYGKWCEQNGSGVDLPSSAWQGSIDATKWWTPDDRVAFAKSASDFSEAEANFGVVCDALALAPEWYTAGFALITASISGTNFLKPTVWDGMMSPLWVQTAEGQVGLTGGGAEEYINQTAVPSSKWSKVTTQMVSPDYSQALQDAKAQKNTDAWTESPDTNPVNGTTPEHDRVNDLQTKVGTQTNDTRAVEAEKFDDTSGNTAVPSAQELAAILPTVSYQDHSGIDHQLRINTSGSSPRVQRHSITDDVKNVGNKTAISLAHEIEVDTKAYLSEADESKRAAKVRDIQSKMAKLETAMATDRGDNRDVQQYREKLETMIGASAERAAQSAVQGWCNQAVGMMAAKIDPALNLAGQIDDSVHSLVDGNPELAALVGGLGVELNGGYAGAVGKDHEDVIAVMKSGNLREQMTHLANFGKWYAGEVYATQNTELSNLLARIGTEKATIEAVLKQKDATSAKAAAEPWAQNKALYADSAAGNGVTTEGYAAAKSDKTDPNGEMDHKLPAIPLAALDDRQLATKARAMGIAWDPATQSRDEVIKLITQSQIRTDVNGGRGDQIGTSGKGESNPMTRSTRGRDTDDTVSLSAREGEAQGNSEKVLPYLEGWKANLVKADHYWIQEARDDLQMPLKAGISGTTYRFMHQANLLGADMADARLACLGYLIPMNAHSFHEICSSAKGYVPYSPGSYVPLAPWGDSTVFKLAEAAGCPKEMVTSLVKGQSNS